MEFTRRAVLGAGLLATAGCSGRPATDEGVTTGAAGDADAPADASAAPSPSTDAVADADANGDVAADPGTGRTGVMLPSVDVGVPGSEGGLVAVRPPGRVVLFDFFATWCAPCRAAMPTLRAVRDRFPRESVFVVSITTERDAAAVRTFWERYDGTWPVLVDPGMRTGRRYGATTIPTTVVVTPAGDVVARHAGLVDESRLAADVTAALDADSPPARSGRSEGF